MRTYCIIPARKGSKRIPNKNFKAFFGRPMIERAIFHAKAIVDTPIVSTDARFGWHGVEKHKRTKHADDESGLLEVMQDVIKCHATIPAYASKDIFVCLLPCTPLLRPESLANAIAAYERFHAASDSMLVSVCEYAHPIDRAMGIACASGRTNGTLWQLDEQADMSVSTSQCCQAYHDAGQFYVATARRWMRGEAILSDGAKPWLLPRYEAVDIDTQEDWTMAEMLYRGQA